MFGVRVWCACLVCVRACVRVPRSLATYLFSRCLPRSPSPSLCLLLLLLCLLYHLLLYCLRRLWFWRAETKASNNNILIRILISLPKCPTSTMAMAHPPWLLACNHVLQLYIYILYIIYIYILKARTAGDRSPGSHWNGRMTAEGEDNSYGPVGT